jgi:DNA (cytosine-5)-methyltransferase 1
LGYAVGWCTFGAVDVGAWHRRDRVFIVAYAGRDRQDRTRRTLSKNGDTPRGNDTGNGRQDVPDAECTRRKETGAGTDINAGREPETGYRRGWQQGQSESRLGGMVDGSTYWMDEPAGIPRVATGIKNRVQRLRGLGNAVVPQQIYEVYQAIMEWEDEQ